MKIILVGGGTAGHINPALALADYIKDKEPDSQILYVGAKGGMEERLVPRAGLSFKGITVSGFCRQINWNGIKKNIKTLKNIITAQKESKKILKEFEPDICVGTGGYVSGPFLMAASKMHIPFIIHDSNSYPGITTKLLAKKASKVFVINNEAKAHLPKNIRAIITGTPVRKKISSVTKPEAQKALGIGDAPVILSFGGSLGARTINKVMAEIIIKHNEDSNFVHIHGFGRSGNSFKQILEKNGIDTQHNPRYIIKEYINNMAECMAAADIVICRAGATTLSELQSAAKPAILIPSPNVAENHQYYNAMALVKENAASMIEEKDLTAESLWNEITRILTGSENLLQKYSQNLYKIAITDADEKIYKIIKDIIKNRRKSI